MALVILAVSLLVIFGVQQRLADGQRRYEAALARAGWEQDLLSIVRELNPSLEPDGVVDLAGSGVVRWSSRPISPARRNRGLLAGQGAFALRLYRVEIGRVDRQGVVRERLSVDRMGWRRLDAPQAAEPAAGLNLERPGPG